MQALLQNFTDRAETERGASLVEYALLIGLIALVCIAALAFIGDGTQQPYSELASRLNQ